VLRRWWLRVGLGTHGRWLGGDSKTLFEPAPAVATVARRQSVGGDDDSGRVRFVVRPNPPRPTYRVWTLWLPVLRLELWQQLW